MGHATNLWYKMVDPPAFLFPSSNRRVKKSAHDLRRSQSSHPGLSRPREDPGWRREERGASLRRSLLPCAGDRPACRCRRKSMPRSSPTIASRHRRLEFPAGSGKSSRFVLHFPVTRSQSVAPALFSALQRSHLGRSDFRAGRMAPVWDIWKARCGDTAGVRGAGNSGWTGRLPFGAFGILGGA